jgi:hypothetical protein
LRRTDFRKAITYSGQKVVGRVVISYKIDGVRILHRHGRFVTRNDKVPPGLDIALTHSAKGKIRYHGDCEIYVGNFKESNALLARHNPEPNSIEVEHIYPLDSAYFDIDPRLVIQTHWDVQPEVVYDYLKKAIELGYEGLVLRTDKHWYRVKAEYTADVRITGWFEQQTVKKVPKGVLGGFTTNYGNVTAFTDEMRVKLWDNPEQHVGKMIQVKYKELYDTGKFRFAVSFMHFRTDKDEESFDTRNI